MRIKAVYSACYGLVAAFIAAYCAVASFKPFSPAVPISITRIILGMIFCVPFAAIYKKRKEPLALCCLLPPAWVALLNLKHIAFRHSAIPFFGEKLISYYCSFLAIAVYLSIRHEWAYAGFVPPPRWRRAILIVPPICILVLGIIVYDHIFWHGPFIRIHGSIFLSKQFLLIMLAVQCLLVGLSEEGLFRGIVLHSLRVYGNLPAILISSFLFGVMHISYFNAGPAKGVDMIIQTTLFGICCAALRLRSNTIWLPIFFHALTSYLGQLHRTDSQLLLGGQVIFLPERSGYMILLNSLLALYGIFILWRTRKRMG